MPYPESRILDALTPTVYLPEVEVVGKNLFSGPALNDDDDIYYISEPTILNSNAKNSERVYTFDPYTGLHPANREKINRYTRAHMDLMDNRKQNGKYMSSGSYTSLNGHVSRFVRLPRPIWEYNTDYMSNKYSKESKKPIMFRMKFQEGGQLTNTQQLGLQYLAQMYSQQTGKDPQQDQEGFMQFVQQLAQQAGVQSIGQLLDLIYQQAQGQAQSAKKGAKLNYLKKLSGRCPEGQLLVYFKAGGRICSKCMAKKQEGDKIEEAKCGSKMKKKKGCGGFKLRKAQNGINLNKDGGRLNQIPFKLYGGYFTPFTGQNNWYYNENGDMVDSYTGKIIKKNKNNNVKFNTNWDYTSILPKPITYISKNKIGGQLKKYQNPDGPILQMPKFLTTELATKRHADIANYYFHEAPTISNLYNGVTNWLKSKMILTPDGTGLVTGTAPIPTKAKNAKEALEMVRAMKAAKAAKSGKPNISTEIDPVKDSWMTDYILRSSKSTLRARAAQARGRKATDIQVRQTTGRGPILYRTGKHTNRGAITTDDIYE